MIKSGVPGLDEILKGGFIEGSSIAVAGGPGCGKSIFSLQFLYEGCKNNEPCLYIITDDTIDGVKREAKSIGLDFDPFEKKGIITFLKEEPRKPLSIAAPLEIIRQKKIKRVVLDNIALFEFSASSEPEFRRSFMHFLSAMKETKVTLVVITQAKASDTGMEHQPEDFLFDGLILLTKIRKGSTFERCIMVIKMRSQEHLLDIFPFKIAKGGITVYTKQIPFSLK